MQPIRSQDFAEGKLPVFVFPASITFYADDQATHKQVLTLYNPYEFVLQFKVLCNNPGKYNVVESQGYVKPRCCIDIVIRATEIYPGLNREDKFRIDVYDRQLHALLGRKEVPSILLPKATEKVGDYLKRKKHIWTLEKERRHSRDFREMTLLMSQGPGSVRVQRTLPSIPVVLLSLVCVFALMLPTYGDTNVHPSIPAYLYLSVSQKLIAAYVLGLITIALLKS